MKALALVMACLIVPVSLSADEKAPLPGKIQSAKTVFMINDSSEPKLGDAFYRELLHAKRWQVVTDRQGADLILIISQRDSPAGVVSIGSANGTAQGYAVGNVAVATQSTTATSTAIPVTNSSWHLYVVDPQTSEVLWNTKATMGARLWRTWNSIAKALYSDIGDRLR
jgi:hypothetical protein